MQHLHSLTISTLTQALMTRGHIFELHCDKEAAVFNLQFGNDDRISVLVEANQADKVEVSLWHVHKAKHHSLGEYSVVRVNEIPLLLTTITHALDGITLTLTGKLKEVI